MGAVLGDSLVIRSLLARHALQTPPELPGEPPLRPHAGATQARVGGDAGSGEGQDFGEAFDDDILTASWSSQIRKSLPFGERRS